LDSGVAFDAAKLVLRDMHLVHEIRVAESLQVLGPIVAIDADLPQDFAIALDRVAMAVVARHAAVDVGLVIEHSGCQTDLLFGCPVAAGAAAEHFFIATGVQAFEMACEARVEGDGDVFALYDLPMTARASQPLAAPEFAQVRRVIEANIHDGAVWLRVLP